MDLQLRPARPDDVDAITAIWHTGWGDAHEGRVPAALYPHRDRTSLRDRVPVRLTTTTVAVVDAAVVGFVMTNGDEVEQLYVDRCFRGSGVAARLLRHGEHAIALRFDRAWLAVVAGNGLARRFYERSGWRDRGSFATKAWTAGGSATIAVPARRYEKTLSRRSVGP